VFLKTFPNPLTPEEERFYLERYKSGDRDAFDVLIEHNMRLVAHLVKKYCCVEMDMEDLISVGTIGLIKAVKTFNIEKNNRLSCYASTCIENEVKMLLRSIKKYGKEVSIYETLGTDSEGNSVQLLDIIECEDEDILERMDQDERIKDLYVFIQDYLTGREKIIICLRYGLYGKKEVTQREIAEKLGISRSYVSRIEKKALKKLRDHFHY
jgi:RNA polymerase sporulation-specific sigma factor